jgi:hypothetical protein
MKRVKRIQSKRTKRNHISVRVGFASTKSYKVAVTKIYSRETNDIDSFLEFAESISKK